MSGRPAYFERIKPSTSPGPGSYIHLETSFHGPSYTMLGRQSACSKHDDDEPGPGKYNPSIDDNGPKHSLQGKRSIGMYDRHAVTPGPGAYNIASAHDYSTTNAPSYSLQGRTERPITALRMQTVGPGKYPEAGNVFKIGNKWSTRYSMLGKPRDYAVFSRTQEPGPTSYYHRSTIAGPKFSIGRRTADFDSAYVATHNVGTLALSTPTIVMPPSTRKVTISEMNALQRRIRSRVAMPRDVDVVFMPDIAATTRNNSH
jgi:hypothetical protein